MLKNKLTDQEKEDLTVLFSYPKGRGYVLEFSDEKLKRFIIDSIRIDIFKRFSSETSKMKKLRKAIDMLPTNKVKKMLSDLLSFMKEKNYVIDSNKELFQKCQNFVSELNPTKIQKKKIKPVRISYIKAKVLLNEVSTEKNPQKRGFKFETFLNDYFKMSGLKPRTPFKICGDQIDGSFDLNNEIYLLEAKWIKEEITKKHIDCFQSKIERQSHYTRGVFISFSKYSKSLLKNIYRGQTPRMFLMNVREIEFCLDNKIPLKKVLEEKARYLAEGECYFDITKINRKKNIK